MPRWIDTYALGVYERSCAIGAVTDPVGPIHIVDANDPVIVDIRNIDPSSRIQRNALRAVKLADTRALGSVRDSVGAAQIVGAENPGVAIGEVERRVGGVVSRTSAGHHARGSIHLIRGAVDGLRGSIHRQRTTEQSRESETTRYVTALAAAGAIFHRLTGCERRVNRHASVS